ncbi:MAG: SDR family oxidoreductase [Gemmatimonadota bacterium]
MSFHGKVAVVTGAGGGIGEGYAKALAAAGAQVVIAEIDADQGQRVATEINEAGGRALAVTTDVSSEDSTQAMAAAAVEAFGGIDYLVNNAAIFKTMEPIGLLDVPLAYFNRFMSVNLTGALLCTRAVYRPMEARGGGAIVNQSSSAAYMAGTGFYGVAKSALNSLTQNLAAMLGAKGIRVNAIAPGPTDTEATRTLVPEAFIEHLTQNLVIKRLGTPDDLTGPLLFLLSDEARWITGQILNVDGGQIMRA